MARGDGSRARGGPSPLDRARRLDRPGRGGDPHLPQLGGSDRRSTHCGRPTARHRQPQPQRSAERPRPGGAAPATRAHRPGPRAHHLRRRLERPDAQPSPAVRVRSGERTPRRTTGRNDRVHAPRARGVAERTLGQSVGQQDGTSARDPHRGRRPSPPQASRGMGVRPLPPERRGVRSVGRRLRRSTRSGCLAHSRPVGPATRLTGHVEPSHAAPIASQA